jgi:hypothetical protein
MSCTYGEMLDTLREAQQVVRAEFEWFAQARGRDDVVLTRLGQSVRSLAGQTDTLLVLMTDDDAADALVEVAEELFDIFRDTEEKIEALLQAGSTSGREIVQQIAHLERGESA